MSFAQFMIPSISPMRLPFNRQSGYAMYHNRDMSTFASRVRSRRKELGLSQAELAKRGKLSQTTISDIERGRNDASREIVELAVALQCAPEWLKTGQGPMEGITQVRSSVIHLGPSAVPVPRPSGQPVPLLATVPAGNWREVVDAYAIGGADSYVMALEDVGAHGFALRVEWNSKDQTFDRDLYAFRAFHDADIISAAVLLTRSEALNPVFRQLGIMQKYGASTTWMGKLTYRIKAGRNGGCPILALGITPNVIEDWT